VVACSVLKRAHRDRLRAADPDLCFVYLKATREQIAERLANRKGHFFPPVLAWAQFVDLEEPGPDEQAIIVPFGQPMDDQAEFVVQTMAL
jgi:gluconokinase